VTAPSGDELAAIAVALEVAAQDGDPAPAETAVAPWSLAMRHPELEFDELLSLRRACSTRF